jgi:nucleoside-diphosphate-sugar epimerase
VGSAIITKLLEDGPRFKITAVTRSTSPYTPPAGSNISHRIADYTSLSSLEEALTGADAVVNCITGGATQYEPSKLIVDAAVAAGVKFFFANEFVGYVTSEQYMRLPEAFVGSKVKIREYLGKLATEGKMQWTSMNGGPFFEMWLMKGPAGFDVANRHARIYGTGNNPLLWTPLSTMALAAVNMLRNPEHTMDRPVYISPFSEGQLTQNRLLDALESAVGAKFTREVVDVKKINQHAKIALERGEAGKAMKGFAVSNQFYEEDSGNDFSHLVENDLVGVESIQVEDAVKAAIAIYGEDCPVVESFFRVEPCEI